MFLSLTLVNPDENLNQKMEFPYTEEVMFPFIRW